MLKRITAFLILTIFMLSAMPVMAETKAEISVSFDAVSNEITVRGEGYGNILITVISDKVNINTLSESIKPEIYKQIKAFGSFTAILSAPDTMVSGEKYQVYVKSAEGEENQSFIYFEYDADAVLNICETLKEKADKKDYKGFGEVMSENAMELCIDTEDGVYTEYFDILSKYTALQKPADFDKFSKAFAYAKTLIKIEKSEKENIYAEIKAGSTVTGFDFEAFSEEISEDEELSENIWGFLADAEFAENLCKDREKTFSSVMDNAVFYVKINSAEGYIALQKLLTESFSEKADSILSSSEYKKVKSKDKIYKALYNKLPFDDGEEFLELFEEETHKQYKSENKKAESTGGSSSGGSSFGGGSAVTTPIKPSEKEEEKVPSFADVPESFWGWEAIRMMAAYGAVNGYPDGKFIPSAPVSRGEFASMLKMFIETAKIDNVENVAFSDVKSGDWYYSAVDLAGRKGIVSGFDGKFRPNDKIKREDATLILYRLLDKMGKKPMGSKKFADDSFVSEYAKEAVAAMGASGFVSGSGEGIFAPTESITRAQAAQLLYNVFIK